MYYGDVTGGRAFADSSRGAAEYRPDRQRDSHRHRVLGGLVASAYAGVRRRNPDRESRRDVGDYRRHRRNDHSRTGIRDSGSNRDTRPNPGIVHTISV